MMYYHASPVAGIRRLEPRVSNHGEPLIYFSSRRENTLVYLSNAVEKYCRETGFAHKGSWQKWGPYGFTKDGRLRLEEYYPDALADTYRGVSGCIYSARQLPEPQPLADIPFAFTAREPVEVQSCEFVPDALEAILAAERAGELVIARYEDLSADFRRWIGETVRREYESSDDASYRHFLLGKFPLLTE